MKTKETIIRVENSGETLYMTKAAYSHYRLTLSTGDYSTHTTKELKRLPKGVSPWHVMSETDINPRIAYPTVESIIEAYRNADESAESYSESEESPLAEFVSSFHYGEVDISQLIDSCRFESETIDLMKQYESTNGIKPLLDILESVSELTLGNIYYQDGEVLSATIGEQEWQVDETLAAAYQTLTSDEKERVRRESGAGIYSSRDDGRFIYTSDDYSRWIMLADEESLVKKLKKALKQKKGA